jgi:hypothetical protein
MNLTILILIVLIPIILCGVICAYYAKKKNRSVTGWFFVGLFLGIIGLFLISVCPKIYTENELRPAAGKKCPYCGTVNLQDRNKCFICNKNI